MKVRGNSRWDGYLEYLPADARFFRLATMLRAGMDDRGQYLGDVADYCGVSISAVSLWASGKRRPSVTNLSRLASLYGWTPDQLWRAVE